MVQVKPKWDRGGSGTEGVRARSRTHVELVGGEGPRSGGGEVRGSGPRLIWRTNVEDGQTGGFGGLIAKEHAVCGVETVSTTVL